MTELDDFRKKIAESPYYFSKPPKKITSWLDDPHFQSLHEKELLSFYKLLADLESKNTLCSIIKQRTIGDCGYLKVAGYREYEHPLVQVKPGEWVVDAGAGDGFTSIRFATAAGTNGKIFSFEPDRENWHLAHTNISENNLEDRIQLESFGLWGTSTTLAFDGGLGGSSFVSQVHSTKGNCYISTVTLDSFFKQNSLNRCDLLSIDVEGAEVEVIKGAQDLIRRYRPKLQVSLYHRPQDLFHIPLLIHALVPEYRFYLGHHSASCIETDLYAVV